MDTTSIIIMIVAVLVVGGIIYYFTKKVTLEQATLAAQQAIQKAVTDERIAAEAAQKAAVTQSLDDAKVAAEAAQVAAVSKAVAEAQAAASVAQQAAVAKAIADAKIASDAVLRAKISEIEAKAKVDLLNYDPRMINCSPTDIVNYDCFISRTYNRLIKNPDFTKLPDNIENEIKQVFIKQLLDKCILKKHLLLMKIVSLNI